MTDDIKLPPLPSSSLNAEGIDGHLHRAYSAKDMQEYVKADRQQRGEPIGNVEIKGGLVVVGVDAEHLGDGVHYLYTAPQPAEPCVSSVSDKTACGSANGDCESQPAEPHAEFDDPRVQQVYEIICGDNHPPAGEHWDGYVSRLIVDALFSGQTVEPEGWRLVPVGLIDFLYAKEHHLPVEDRHVLSIMLEAVPKFGEED